ncbi:Hypothetical protein LUCI_0669 [Lucifera butyrica]|uniref:Copper amine oxidase n=1 Tax=Lucifera butyrica TaxID=1351585 RepID=A0A498R2R5_9FIRM|nr:copper amine oxidase [Lucifera butyrica]VBB05459.1 Hypothetical protein LUCI_0669 [Lucifera butyrica]
MMKWLQRFVAVAVLCITLTGPALAAGLNNIDVLKLPEWPVLTSSYGGTLLLSDSPETAPADGILYQDTVSGNVRLFVYNVNGTSKPKKIVVLLENSGPKNAHVIVYQHGFAGPSENYMDVGKTAQADYLAGGGLYRTEVPAGDSAYLDRHLNDVVVKPNMLINGIYDFLTDRPVKVSVLMLPVHADAGRYIRHAKILPADAQHLRGTFEGPNRLLIPEQVYNPADKQMFALTLADNKIDRYLTGVDATDGSPVVNYGNYGVMYKLFIPSDYPGKMAFFLNPRGGSYAGFIGLKYRHVKLPSIATPSGRLALGDEKMTDFAPVGVYEGGQSLWFTFSPPGASNLPVKLIVIPQ